MKCLGGRGYILGGHGRSRRQELDYRQERQGEAAKTLCGILDHVSPEAAFPALREPTGSPQSKSPPAEQEAMVGWLE